MGSALPENTLRHLMGHLSSATPKRAWSAETLREWRGQMGWTQARAAQELDITRESYNRMENGSPIDKRTAMACMGIATGLTN